jgi:hydroxymethylbilane synthase
VSRALRIGTRASALALWQAHHVQSRLSALPGAPPVELVHIKTEGDLNTAVPLWQVPGKAFFTKEIDRALLAGSVDIAVHSLKDLSTTLEPGLTLAATLPREDARDALISRSGAALTELPPGARIGTSSLRRRAFLARLRPDLKQVELRGNVPTRVERLRQGDYDAIILAAAGLKRLGLGGQISMHLDADAWPPAVAQGVIGICARSDDAETLRWLASLDDPAARLAVSAERALLATLEGGCQVPLGALARLAGHELSLDVLVCSLDGRDSLTDNAREILPESLPLPSAIALGERVARDLLAAGAGALVARERAARAVDEP